MKRIVVIFMVFNSLISVCRAQYTIYTFAGDGVSGFSGDGGQATVAELTSPWGICADGSGNIYIADYNNNRVRKINTGTGVITTFAGNGTAGYSGDGGQATAAELYWPCGVYADASGNIYIGDALNERIRKVATNGVITTVAGDGTASFSGDGGQATAAEIDYPTGVWGDPSGNLFIADQMNHRVRKVTTGGIITTVAGNGIAGYSGDGGPATAAEFYISHVSTDGAGNIYIADWFNSAIRFVNISTNIITTIAGNGVGGFSGDGGPATAAELNHPGDCLPDASGNLWICDGSNNRIRLVSAGIIKTVAGDGVGSYCCDGGPATAAELNYPEGICVYSSTEYLTDYANYRGRKLTGGIVLPITLQSFTAGYVSANNNVLLSWTTATEVNNKEFTIEKTYTGDNWEDIATIAGAGTTSLTHNYSTTDQNIQPGVIYYRLKQTDYDGHFTLSDEAVVTVPESDFTTVFPNPLTGNNLILHYSSSTRTDVSISVVSVDGATVIQPYTISNVPAGANNISVNCSGLAKGAYYIIVSNAAHIYHVEFIKL